MATIRPLLALALLILAVVPEPGQQPPVEFRVLESDPGFTGRIGMGGALYIRLSYKSQRPVRFQAEGRAAGQKVAAGASYNIAPPYPAGEARRWCGSPSGRRRRSTRSGSTLSMSDGRPLVSINVPARLEWSGPAHARSRPEWAERLNRAQQEQRACNAEGERRP